MSIAGARPNFMKLAPLAHCMRERDDVRHLLVHTGQHYDQNMSESFFRDLDMPEPDVNLEVGSLSHAAQTARIMERIEPVMLEHRPHWVVVVGDVNSTMAATLVAVKLGFKVAHVEAGLRSFDRDMPEEINRLVTDALADLLLTHSPEADENLVREGVAREKIVRVGNIMIDSLIKNLPRIDGAGACERIGVEPGGFCYVTLHRPSNVDDKNTLEKIVDELLALADKLPVVFPVHPRTRARLQDSGLLEKMEKGRGMKIMEPLGYHQSMCLTRNARLVLTDSGGIQEETTFLGVPCLTLRENTERPVTVSQGTNRLTSIGRLKKDIDDVFEGRHPRKDASIPELWDGKTAQRILDELLKRA